MVGLVADSRQSGARRAGRRWVGGALGAIGAAGLLAWALAGPAAAAGGNVSIAGFAFAPGSLTVAAGQTVTWVNNDGVAHTATGAAFDTGPIAPGASASVKMAKAGTFTYHCAIHPSMTGTIIVTAAAASPTPKPTKAPAATPKATHRATAAPLPQTDAATPPSAPGDGVGLFAAEAGLVVVGALAFTTRRRQAVRVRRQAHPSRTRR